MSASPKNADQLDYLDPSTLAQIDQFEVRARHLTEGMMSGMHRSPHFGFSVEFAQHRSYVQGDDIRHIDWKVFSRTDRLYIKQYEQETNLDLILLVDASASMSYHSSDQKKSPWRKYDHATALAAAMSYLAIAQQDRVGLYVFADQLTASLPPANKSGHWQNIVQSLSNQPIDRPTQIGRVCDQLIAKIHQRSMIVVLSDLFESIDMIEAFLAKLKHHRHDVILMQTLDADEINFPLNQPSRFDDLETDQKLRLDPQSLRTAYLSAMADHLATIQDRCHRFHFDHEIVNTAEPLGPTLSRYLARRMANLKRT